MQLVVLVAFTTLMVVVTLVVVALIISAALHFLGQVMHADGIQMIDRRLEVMHALFLVTVLLVLLALVVAALSLVMEMSHSLCQLLFMTLGLFVAIFFT